ncbi:MAG TPA: DegT/DnrJ/EryC1/StrS family aminotransferase [Dehalococcoidia bacterium]
MTSASSGLAINGGTPVRTTPLDTEKGLGYLSDEEVEAALEVLHSRSLFRYYGPDLRKKVEAFEGQLRTLVGSAHAVGVSSGTAALQCGLVGLRAQEGDEVIVPAVTFIATVGVVVNARAVPVFAEVDDSLNLDPASLEANITEKTKAVIPVHLSNTPCDMEPIMAVARKHGIKVLEDAAQAIGVTYRGRHVGAIGDAGAFSLQLDKNITSGEGGALVTDDWDVYDRAVRYQDQGGQFTTSKGEVRDHTSGEPFIGVNLRMNEIAGAIAEVQAGRLPGLIAAMRERAHSIRRRLGDLPVEWRRIPDEAGEGGNVTMFFDTQAIATDFSAALKAEGIPAGKVYGGRPVYANPAVLAQRTPWERGAPFASTEFPTERHYYMGMCPRSEDLLARSMSVAIGPKLTDADEEDIVRAVRKVADALL